MASVAGSEAKREDDQAHEMESAAGGLVAPRGIDKERSRYPYCIVWTPLPIITWFLPPIGDERSVLVPRRAARNRYHLGQRVLLLYCRFGLHQHTSYPFTAYTRRVLRAGAFLCRELRLQ